MNPVIALWLQAWALVGRVAELGRYPLFQLEIINLLRYLIATLVGVHLKLVLSKFMAFKRRGQITLPFLLIK